VIVLADSSPLIALAKIGLFFLLQKLFGSIVISGEVYAEVVVSGAGMPGAADTAKSPWIEVRQIKNLANLTTAQTRFGLGAGELSTIILGKEIGADLIILDDLGARKLAQKEGFKVQGTIAILEACFRKGYFTDLRQAYNQLLNNGIYLNRDLLNLSLKTLNLPPL
jgi:predicted nucleic acid-binding protein